MNLVRRPGRVVLLGVVLVVSLSACAPALGTEPSPPPPSPTEAVPTSTPLPTKPEPRELILSPDGLGALVIGQTPPQVDPALDVLIFDADYCADVPEDAVPEPIEPGLWLANYPVQDGIHLGSTLAEVQAAYGGSLVFEIDNTVSTVYSVSGTVGQLLIEIHTDGWADYWEPDEIDKVALLTVIPAGDSPFAVAGGDSYFWGECTGP